jgi:hypothetical protein
MLQRCATGNERKANTESRIASPECIASAGENF